MAAVSRYVCFPFSCRGSHGARRIATLWYAFVSTVAVKLTCHAIDLGRVRVGGGVEVPQGGSGFGSGLFADDKKLTLNRWISSFN